MAVRRELADWQGHRCPEPHHEHRRSGGALSGARCARRWLVPAGRARQGARAGGSCQKSPLGVLLRWQNEMQGSVWCNGLQKSLSYAHLMATESFSKVSNAPVLCPPRVKSPGTHAHPVAARAGGWTATKCIGTAAECFVVMADTISGREECVQALPRTLSTFRLSICPLQRPVDLFSLRTVRDVKITCMYYVGIPTCRNSYHM